MASPTNPHGVVTDPDFKMWDQLSKSKYTLLQWPLCEVMLMDDSNFLWLVLIPRKKGLTEMHDLQPNEQYELMDEITAASKALEAVAAAHFGKPPTKVNVAGIGNMCRQLHIHVLTRYEGDKAWPGPVWSACPAVPYSEGDKAKLMSALTAELSKLKQPVSGV